MSNYPDSTHPRLPAKFLLGWMLLETHTDENGLSFSLLRPVTALEQLYVRHVWCDSTVKDNWRTYQVIR